MGKMREGIALVTGMTDHGQEDVDRLPEPSPDKLYQLYVESLKHFRKKLMREAAEVIGDTHLEELLATQHQPVSEEQFRQHLVQLEERGRRHVYVNRLVLGARYCEEHPDDPRVRLLPLTDAERERLSTELAEETLRLFRNRGFDPSPRGTALR